MKLFQTSFLLITFSFFFNQIALAQRIDFEKVSPRQLLRLLSNPQNKKFQGNYQDFMDKAPLSWIKPDDLSYLVSMIESTDTCKCMVSPLSSYYSPNDFATLGGHAIEMITCYREGRRYPTLFFNCPKANEAAIKEIKEWWAKSKGNLD